MLLEEVKDSALAIYSRDVAVAGGRTHAAVGDFAALTPEHARELARRYDLDYLVTEADLPLAGRVPKRAVPRLLAALAPAPSPSYLALSP